LLIAEKFADKDFEMQQHITDKLSLDEIVWGETERVVPESLSTAVKLPPSKPTLQAVIEQ